VLRELKPWCTLLRGVVMWCAVLVLVMSGVVWCCGVLFSVGFAVLCSQAPLRACAMVLFDIIRTAIQC
jgi:hypothetical protein